MEPTQHIATKSSPMDNPSPQICDMDNSPIIVENEGESPQSMVGTRNSVTSDVPANDNAKGRKRGRLPKSTNNNIPIQPNKEGVPLGRVVTKSSPMDNPPPQICDMDNSPIIVENDGESPQSMVGTRNSVTSDMPANDNARGRKRGRLPKSTNNNTPPIQPNKEGDEEPQSKKVCNELATPPTSLQKQLTVAQLRKREKSFLQDRPCFEVAPKLAKCRECRSTPHNMQDIFCRFYAFRRLRYTNIGHLLTAGFLDPHLDASPNDFNLWLPAANPLGLPPASDLGQSHYLLSLLSDPFCQIVQQENEALTVHMSKDNLIAWKKVVQGVREMCDVCQTTLFNYHWACKKCGFVVCIDCYKDRKIGIVKEWSVADGVRDNVSWLLCTNHQPHEQDKLMLTQIVAGDALQTISREAHEACAQLGIPINCGCALAQQLTAHDKSNDLWRAEPVIERIKPEKDEESVVDNGNNRKTDPLYWLADLALSSEDKKHGDTGSSDSDTEDNDQSTLRDLLIRVPSNKGGTPEKNSSSSENCTMLPNENAKGELMCTKNKEIGNRTNTTAQVQSENLVHYVSRYTGASKGGSMSLPLRIMTLSESSLFYPDVPHLWLCDGKLLQLLVADNPGNHSIFQDQWKRGQPVMVSNVTKNMDMSLWHPNAFARDFGDDKCLLVNCLTGKIVPNQPMRKFWEGFDSLAKRLKDEKGQPMALKLKDWPPTEDFSKILPNRFNDLMKVLPLKEYTMRDGSLNLVSRLPDCFARPDLGPKMYTAYATAGQHKGTTNLHLDISDAVNVMIYVSIPEDASEEEYTDAMRAIDEANCDILTRRRVRESGILPGALWHIYLARDADKIRDFLNKVALERGARLQPHDDPIHDQTWYIDSELQKRLYREYNVQGFPIIQCQGDAVFIPAGAPHQVKNLHNCIKVAEDFVSPENVSHCFHLTQEFRELPDTHSNHEDKLQIKNIMYHAVKDSLRVLSTLKTEPSASAKLQ
ncbi:lysine-specific demethylase 3B isoform X2 [Nilaparvata lugens]|uniref:lysine-specific demethylase 3B isoform X2 n=1 Tax=Nilaparvata lugens TaxID=108931 RepID=UPI00193EB7E9|nr:lysine-specific demethylase 3B isoform X2 [Nilaparvata lugens]